MRVPAAIRRFVGFPMDTFATNGEFGNSVQDTPDLNDCQCGECKCCRDLQSTVQHHEVEVDDDYNDCDCCFCCGYYDPVMLPRLVDLARQEAVIDQAEEADERLVRRKNKEKQQTRRKERRSRC